MSQKPTILLLKPEQLGALRDLLADQEPDAYGGIANLIGTQLNDQAFVRMLAGL